MNADDADRAGISAPLLARGWYLEDCVMRHLVLLGDSIFDNGFYVPREPAVIEQVQATLSGDWTATLVAVDGNVVIDVPRQLERLPADATHLAISVGGNDALRHIGVLQQAGQSVGEVLRTMGGIQDEFHREYRAMLEAVLARNLPTVVCTIYDAIPDLPREAVAAVGFFNDVILREAARGGRAGGRFAVAVPGERRLCGGFADRALGDWRGEDCRGDRADSHDARFFTARVRAVLVEQPRMTRTCADGGRWIRRKRRQRRGDGGSSGDSPLTYSTHPQCAGLGYTAAREKRTAMIQFSHPPAGERFAEIQREVDRRYPSGRFVAVEAGSMIADAESHEKLVEKLRSQGKSPKDLVILQAGVQYPASAVIFSK